MSSRRSHIDDLTRALFAHVQTRILAGIHGREQVALKDATDIIGVDLQCIIGVGPGSAAANVPTSIVDQDIKMTQCCQHLLHEVFRLCRVSQVGAEKSGAATQSTDLLCHRWSRRGLSELRRCALVHVVNNHISTRPGQMQGIMATQSAARACYQGSLSRQVDCVHGCTFQLMESSRQWLSVCSKRARCPPGRLLSVAFSMRYSSSHRG